MSARQLRCTVFTASYIPVSGCMSSFADRVASEIHMLSQGNVCGGSTLAATSCANSRQPRQSLCFQTKTMQRLAHHQDHNLTPKILAGRGFPDVAKEPKKIRNVAIPPAEKKLAYLRILPSCEPKGMAFSFSIPFREQPSA